MGSQEGGKGRNPGDLWHCPCTDAQTEAQRVSGFAHGTHGWQSWDSGPPIPQFSLFQKERAEITKDD